MSANLDKTGSRGLDFTLVDVKTDTTAGTLSAGAVVDLPMKLMTIADIKTALIASNVEASYGVQKVELVMMLDVTGSMRGSKINSLKKAAQSAVKILLPSNIVDPTKMRIGLVPYSTSINAGKYARIASNYQSKRCITERGGDESYSDASPITYPVGADWRAVRTNNCPKIAVRALTSDRDVLIRDIKSLVARGGFVAWND